MCISKTVTCALACAKQWIGHTCMDAMCSSYNHDCVVIRKLHFSNCGQNLLSNNVWKGKHKATLPNLEIIKSMFWNKKYVMLVWNPLIIYLFILFWNKKPTNYLPSTRIQIISIFMFKIMFTLIILCHLI